MSPLIAGSAAVASMPLSSWLDDAIYIYPVGNPPLSSAAGSYPRARTIIATASSNVTLSSGLKVPSVSPTTKPCWSAVLIAPVAQWSAGTSGNFVIPLELFTTSSSPIEYTATFAISLLRIGSLGLNAPDSASPTIIPNAPRSSAASAYFVSDISGDSATRAVLYLDCAIFEFIGMVAIPLYFEPFSINVVETPLVMSIVPSVFVPSNVRRLTSC